MRRLARWLCLAFALAEKSHLNVDTSVLERRHLQPGRWIDTLKQAIRTGAPDDQPLTALVRDLVRRIASL